MKRISNLFIRVRRRTGVTQEQMADCIGIAVGNLSKLENQRPHALKAQYLANLYKAGFLVVKMFLSV